MFRAGSGNIKYYEYVIDENHGRTFDFIDAN
jgi:hypothetical protein